MYCLVCEQFSYVDDFAIDLVRSLPGIKNVPMQHHCYHCEVNPPLVHVLVCDVCWGSKKVEGEKCKACKGTGREFMLQGAKSNVVPLLPSRRRLKEMAKEEES